MKLYQILIYTAGAFLIGSIPFAYIITKIVTGEDIRDVGSGNPGATNVVRALNLKYGSIVLLLDMAKGFLPVLLATKSPYPYMVPLIAFALVIGHDYTPFLGFQGGKGVATSLGIFLVLNPVVTFIVVLIFVVITSVFKFVSFGSLLGAVSYPVIAYIMGRTEYIWVAAGLAALIVYKHKSNIKRLWQGSEKRSV